ncbi:hypothetical protein GSI_09876 [Ganoderma sinense ZZ0214-1]|uniref:Transporter n=1 Tax=Ganoderma sinense ZZ0214-1 TaxID=1077348 RepID=A0A2G8S2N0_9APHY|nr:hypothetical protein GSI_09876 [Ganoderma sinense ZZ0214-1]
MFVAIVILGELALTVESFVQPGLSHWKEFSYRLTSTALGMAITADVFLTTVLTVVLHRSRTGFKSLNSRNSPSGYTKDDFKGNAYEIGAVPVNDLSTHSATTLSGNDVSTPSEHVLHIRVTRQTGTSQNGSFSGDVTLIDRKAEPSIELCNLQSSADSLKGNAAPSPDGLFHHD